MGHTRQVRPALRLLVMFSRHVQALEWARAEAVSLWGPVCLESPLFEFDQTEYYAATMGQALRKQFLAFERLMSPDQLAAAKRQSNVWEDQYARISGWPEVRPLNLDPGYLTEAKLVLASTKDRDHRIYLGQGIFGEVTLHYHAGSWKTRPWTYPDYATEGYHRFLDQARTYLRTRYRAEPPGPASR